MAHDNILGFSPILDGKMLNLNMTRTFSGDTVVDHIDSRHVVFVERGWTNLRVSDFQEDGTQVLGVLGCCDGSNKFGFSASCIYR